MNDGPSFEGVYPDRERERLQIVNTSRGGESDSVIPSAQKKTAAFVRIWSVDGAVF